MKSLAINTLYSKHPFYKKRTETDKMFALQPHSVSMKGNLDRAIRFIEDYQLMDPQLWSRFVTQFRDTHPKADDKDNGWRGEYWGKMMRGACFTYQYTGNEELYSILCDTVKDMMTTADKNGRISSYSYDKQYNGWDIWSRKYVLLGMQYFIEICKDEALIKQTTDCMKGQADYMISTLGHEKDGKIEITKASTHWLGMNSSSLLEPIVRLYNLTGEQKYLDFATYIVECGVISTPGVDIFELAYRDELAPYQYPVTKAYEMMSCFEGLLEYYRVTGIEKWKTAVINFAKKVRLTDISVIGSAGCTHELFDHTLVRQVNTLYNGVLQETCVTVTWIKFCFQVLCLTGDPIFADEIEKSVYNALLGAINFDKLKKNGGLPFDSYSPLLFNTRLRGIGGKKIMADGTFYGCCACIGSAGTGLIGLSSAMLTENGLAINLYANAEINTFAPDGSEIKLKITTDYPADGIVTVEFLTDCKNETELALRIPSWSEANLVALNGVRVEATAGSYARYSRLWRKGDYITISLDMTCRLITATPDPKDPNSAYHVALRRGPLMLARDKRLGEDIEATVDFGSENGALVQCEYEKCASFDHFYSFIVNEANGHKIKMIDYASAGRTWDEDSMTTVWMPTRNYWSVDLNLPIAISSPSFWGNSDDKFSFTVSSSSQVMVTTGRGDTFVFEPTENGLYRIKLLNSELYLDESDGILVANNTGKEWLVTKFAQNRYRISDGRGNYICGNNNATTDPFIRVSEFDITPKQVLRFENL